LECPDTVDGDLEWGSCCRHNAVMLMLELKLRMNDSRGLTRQG
jgi:hypothetical protein